MTQRAFVIFGASSFLGDLFDIIHAVGGRVSRLYQNVPEVRRERVVPLSGRMARLGYGVEVFDSLDSFQRQEGEEYVLGCTTVLKYALVGTLRDRYGLHFSSLIHPSAQIGSGVDLGEGVVLNTGVILAPHACISDFAVVNRGVTVGHDTRIGEHTRIMPSSAIGGSGPIGGYCSVGIHATILEELNVGDWSVVGAGSVVTRDIPSGVIAYGTPAKVVRLNDAAPTPSVTGGA